MYNLLKFMNKCFYNSLINLSIQKGDIFIEIHPNYLYNFIFFFKNNTLFQCKLILEHTVWPLYFKKDKYVVFYCFFSEKYLNKIYTYFIIDWKKDKINSLIELYPGIDWYEREVWDFFGINYKNRNFTNRILTDYGFIGHPLNKDFPLSGFYEIEYDFSTKRINTYPIIMTQEIKIPKTFNLLNLINKKIYPRTFLTREVMLDNLN